MGNTLCKNRINRNGSPKSSVDRVFDRCAQICPQSLVKKKPFWEKQVLETSPPLCEQPKLNSTGWQSATLSVPDSPVDANGLPIAPPRKKRHHKPDANNVENVKPNDITPKITIDVPTENEEESESNKKEEPVTTDSDCDEWNSKSATLECKNKIQSSTISPNITPEEEPVSSAAVESHEDQQILKTPVTVTRKVSKVGNKKSDKFFGEKLSDLSNEPIVTVETTEAAIVPPLTPTSTDEVDNFNESKIMIMEPSEEMMRKINKETGKIMFSIEKQVAKEEEIDPNDERQPVEEEIIVPVRKVFKHICDDDTHLHEFVSKPVPDPKAPKKPQRDFTKYRKSLENSKSVESLEASQELNPSPTDPEITEKIEAPIKKSAEEDLISETETIPADDMNGDSGAKDQVERRKESDSIPSNMSHSEKILRRCLSSQSYLTPDLIDKIAQQANTLSLSDAYLPEDYISSSNDGSALVSPNYKLNEPRRLSSQISEQGKSDSTSDISASKTTLNSENEKPEEKTVADKEEKGSKKALKIEIQNSLIASTSRENSKPSTPTTPDAPTVIKRQLSTPDSQEKQIRRKRISSTLGDKCEISNAIQTFLAREDLSPTNILKLLEDEFGDVLNSQSVPAEDKKTIEQLKRSLSQTESSELDTSVKKEDLKSEEDKPIPPETSQPASPTETTLTERKTESGKSARSKPVSNIPVLIKNKSVDALISNDKRRHSIDDLDTWFTPNPKPENKFPEVKRKREVSLPNCLESPEKKEITMNNATPNQAIESKQSSEKYNDHSSLLRFLEHEKSNYRK